MGFVVLCGATVNKSSLLFIFIIVEIIRTFPECLECFQNNIACFLKLENSRSSYDYNYLVILVTLCSFRGGAAVFRLFSNIDIVCIVCMHIVCVRKHKRGHCMKQWCAPELWDTESCQSSAWDYWCMGLLVHRIQGCGFRYFS